FQEDAETQGSAPITTTEPVTTASVPITTAGVSVSTVEPSTPPTTTILVEDEDLTITQTLMKMRTQRLQAEEQIELTIEERSKLFVELMDKRKKHFAKLRAEEIRRKPPTKAQKRNQISKRASTELEQERIKKQKIDDDQEEAEMKKHMEIVVDEEEIAVDAIPLANKPPIIIDWKIIKEGKIRYFQIIRTDGSSRRYLLMIKMLQNIDREDLETLWKLVKAKHGNSRPGEAYERVLWGDLKVMFEPDVESDVWRNLQGHKVIVWKLFSTSGVHFVRFQNLHIFMLVEKKYPLTPATIIAMLNKKLQADHWNEMCY
ncbi:hypothetical protein Tco_1496766, partial [Tanacetum coccineum]